MLKTLRKKGVMKKILWGVIVVIVVVFGLFGTASYLDYKSSSSAGKIFNRKIPITQFTRTYQHTRQQALLTYGDNFSKVSQFLNLEAQTWDRLMLLYEAQRKGIRVTDKQVVETIQDYPFFQRNEKFNPSLYHDILRSIFRTPPRDFEESTRESLMIKKLYERETALVTIPEETIWENYKEKNEKVRVNYVFFTTEDFNSEVTFPEEEVQDYYAKYKDTFLLAPMVNVQYILLPFTEDAKEEEKAALKTKADTIAKDITSNPDLSKIAEKYNLPLKESGFFSQEQPNLNIGFSFELLQKVFELKENETSAPIVTPQGFYIVRIKEEKEAHVASLEEAGGKVREALIREKAQAIAKTKAEEFLQKIKEGLHNDPSKDFIALAKELGLTVEQTPDFTRGQYLPNIGISKEFQEAAFSLTNDNKISEIVKMPKGHCLLHLDGFTAVDPNQFAKEKEQFAQTLIDAKKSQAFNEFISKLRIKANLQDNISKIKAQQAGH